MAKELTEKNCLRCGTKFKQVRWGQLYCTVNCQSQVWREKNPEKVKETERRYRNSHPEKIKIAQRKSALKRKYGMTIDEYNSILSSQNGKCAICGDVKEETLCVDHDHKTGKVRGLLCHHCNHVAGFAKDNIGILKKMMEYLTSQQVKC